MMNLLLFIDIHKVYKRFQAILISVPVLSIEQMYTNVVKESSTRFDSISSNDQNEKED